MSTNASYQQGVLDGLNVSEIFGPIWQGEGPSTGRLFTFIRLQGCNLRCSFCDTPYAILSDKGRAWTVEDVAARVRSLSRSTPCLLTGGEPLLQRENVIKLIRALSDRMFEIETNGTQEPIYGATVKYNVSPKTFKMTDVLEHYIGGASTFKFVCHTVEDVAQVAVMGLPPEAVWIMPLGKTVLEIDASLAAIRDETLRHGFCITDRMHIRLWGGKRGY